MVKKKRQPDSIDYARALAEASFDLLPDGKLGSPVVLLQGIAEYTGALLADLPTNATMAFIAQLVENIKMYRDEYEKRKAADPNVDEKLTEMGQAMMDARKATKQ